MSFCCQQCGACCANSMDNKWIQVTKQDAEQIPASLLQDGDIEKFAMKQKLNGLCIALLGRVNHDCGCLIYATRPAICRVVQPQDTVCLTARKLYDIR